MYEGYMVGRSSILFATSWMAETIHIITDITIEPAIIILGNNFP
jgi:hypothetical protein